MYRQRPYRILYNIVDMRHKATLFVSQTEEPRRSRPSPSVAASVCSEFPMLFLPFLNASYTFDNPNYTCYSYTP